MAKKLKLLKEIGTLVNSNLNNVDVNDLDYEILKSLNGFRSSLYDTELEDFVKAVRSEWEIENNLHWHLDVVFKEDKNLVSEKKTQKNLNILRKLGLNILKMAQPIYKLSLKNIRLKLCMNFENEFYKLLTLLDKDKIIEFIDSSKT